MPEIPVLQKMPTGSTRLKTSFGILVSIAIAAIAAFALTHIFKNVNYAGVLEGIQHTHPAMIALALLLVVASYATMTLYDWFSLRTIGRLDIPYRIAALASFTSYPISHGIGAVALVSPIIRFRIYSRNGLTAIDVANICFLTGLTFWLGNLTALGFSLLSEPRAVRLIDHMPPLANRLIAVALLFGVATFLVWSSLRPRHIGFRRWSLRLPSGPMVLIQIAIGITDLGAAALAMYVLLPAGMDVGIWRLTSVFIVATMLGFISQTPAGMGAFDAALLVGIGGDNKEAAIATLLLFRFLYHFLPFVLALVLFGCVEGWRSLRTKQTSLKPQPQIEFETDHPDNGYAEHQAR